MDDQVGHAIIIKTKPNPLSFLKPLVLNTSSLEKNTKLLNFVFRIDSKEKSTIIEMHISKQALDKPNTVAVLK